MDFVAEMRELRDREPTIENINLKEKIIAILCNQTKVQRVPLWIWRHSEKERHFTTVNV